MNREIHGWYSPNLGKWMEIAIYGHYGDALLMIPTAAADYLEYERFSLIDAIQKPINEGKFKVFSINSINTESWMHGSMLPHHKAINHQKFNSYVYEEVIPFIRYKTSNETSIYVTGASFGALHSANLFFKRPDIFNGVIAMSGCYDLTSYTKGFWSDDVYFNSPIHYLPNLNDQYFLHHLHSSNHIHIVTGSGNYEDPAASQYLSNILNAKGIQHELSIWGWDTPHDWPSWRKMLPYYLESRF